MGYRGSILEKSDRYEVVARQYGIDPSPVQPWLDTTEKTDKMDQGSRLTILQMYYKILPS